MRPPIPVRISQLSTPYKKDFKYDDDPMYVDYGSFVLCKYCINHEDDDAQCYGFDLDDLHFSSGHVGRRYFQDCTGFQLSFKCMKVEDKFILLCKGEVDVQQ